MKRAISLWTALLVCGLAGLSGAQTSTRTTDPDTYNQNSVQPTIKATVVSTSDNTITVDTFDGERMTFYVDSRTTMPTSLPVGSRVRVEFQAMQDGRQHAARVTPFEPTAEEIASIRPVTGADHTGMMGTSTTNTSDDLSGTARTDVSGTTGYGPQGAADPRTQQSDEDADSRASATGTMSATDADGDGVADSELPRTAGERQGLWMIGLGALGLAGTLFFMRRRTA